MGLITVGTNSYVDLTYADEYLSHRLFNDAWVNSTIVQKEQALIMATGKIDRQILSGIKAILTQKLQFPRSIYSYSISEWNIQTEVPSNVKNAVCEEALALLDFGDSKRLKLQKQGVTNVNLGNISESYNGNIKKLLSDEARELIQPFLGSVSIC